nr:uncharacterized protein LOC128703618 [Cherax quadricarinatus]
MAGGGCEVYKSRCALSATDYTGTSSSNTYCTLPNTLTMKNLALMVVLACTAAAAAAVPRLRRDSTSLVLELPSNASLILGSVQTGFECADLPYGYYADEANNCAVFHVCLPLINFGEVQIRHFSFFCGEGTIFDQQRLVCALPQEAVPCSQAAAYRKSNEYFGPLLT